MFLPASPSSDQRNKRSMVIESFYPQTVAASTGLFQSCCMTPEH
ncbi:hypothetical protein [Lysobacter gummosus]